MTRGRRTPSEESQAAARLTAFIRSHLSECPAEDWLIFYDHAPSGVRVCVKCGEAWPCSPLLKLAARWQDDPTYRDEWKIEV